MAGTCSAAQSWIYLAEPSNRPLGLTERSEADLPSFLDDKMPICWLHVGSHKGGVLQDRAILLASTLQFLFSLSFPFPSPLCSLSLSLSLSPSPSHSLSLPLSLSHSLTLTLSHTHTYTTPVCVQSLSITPSPSHSLSLPLSLSHSHSHSLTHTHTPRLCAFSRYP